MNGVGLLYLLVLLLIIGIIITIISLGVLAFVKFPKHRLKMIISVVSIIIVVVSYLSIDHYISFKWFYDIENDLKQQYTFVNKIDISTKYPALSISFYCKDDPGDDEIIKLFETLKKDLLSDEIQEKSTKAFLKTNSSTYSQINIRFDINSDGKSEIMFLARNESFSQWDYVNRNDIDTIIE